MPIVLFYCDICTKRLNSYVPGTSFKKMKSKKGQDPEEKYVENMKLKGIEDRQKLEKTSV